MSPASLPKLIYASLLFGFVGLFAPWATVQIHVQWSSVPPAGWEPPVPLPITAWEGLLFGADATAFTSSTAETQFRMGLVSLPRFVLAGGPVLWMAMLLLSWRRLPGKSRGRVLLLVATLLLGAIVLLSLTGPELISYAGSLLRYGESARISVETVRWQWGALFAILMSLLFALAVTVSSLLPPTISGTPRPQAILSEPH
jgi:hypothetical protein